MTIKKRLAVSNIMMILVPIVVTLMIALCCLGVIWYTFVNGTGIGFEDSEDFYQASSDISAIVSEALEHADDRERLQALNTIGSVLDRSAMSLIVTANGKDFYQYGSVGETPEDTKLAAAALELDNEGIISFGTRNLYVHSQSNAGVDYVIYLYNTQSELSYTGLKVALVITCSILLLAIFFSVFFTDRFLTRFVFKHIEEPLVLLSDGVREISEGNLDYRLDYKGKDEFLPVCQAFNSMAARLKQSVERSRQEEESRKELMASISHDLRSPLTSIQAYVEGLLDGVASTPEAQQKYLVTIKRRAEELEGMVARILTYSRLEMENAPHNAVVMRLDEYLKSEVNTLSADYADRGLALSAEAEPFAVLADPVELHQLIVNIADNSLKYKTKEKGALHIALWNKGEHCVLSFTDDGPGVPAEALPKLFDVFYRTDPSRSDRSKGSGLGLAIVEKTVLRMGGSVRAGNGENGGLVIRIELPKGGDANAEDINY